MKKIIISLLFLTILVIFGISFNKPPISDLSDNPSTGGKIYLSSNNTTSVTTDEYHQNPNINDPSYKSGEWTPNNNETYASLIKINIPQLKDVSKVTLHFKLSAYHNKDIYSKDKKGKCIIPKNFVIKRIFSSWKPETSTYNIIRSLQESGQTIGNFTINSNSQIGSYISIEVPTSEINSIHGFTIDQNDSTPCRVSFYGHSSNPSNQPYISF
jgi:hypothetical protein